MGRLLGVLRRAKHSAYRAQLLAVGRARDQVFPVLDVLTRYRWDPMSCPGSDQYGVVAELEEATHPVTRRIFCVWAGDNPMNENRRRCIEATMNRQHNMEFVLVSPANLEEWIADGHPLHPAYPFLSYVHRSDYLRCYLLHHYGGGYVDVKATRHAWSAVFDRLDAHPEWVGVGYREAGASFPGKPEGPMTEVLARHYAKLIGCCAMIMRPNTTFTQRWYASLHKELDSKLDALRDHPGGLHGEAQGYPLRWTQILGEIFQP